MAPVVLSASDVSTDDEMCEELPASFARHQFARQRGSCEAEQVQAAKRQRSARAFVAPPAPPDDMSAEHAEDGMGAEHAELLERMLEARREKPRAKERLRAVIAARMNSEMDLGMRPNPMVAHAFGVTVQPHMLEPAAQ